MLDAIERSFTLPGLRLCSCSSNSLIRASMYYRSPLWLVCSRLPSGDILAQGNIRGRSFRRTLSETVIPINTQHSRIFSVYFFLLMFIETRYNGSATLRWS
jgi:hypothetical protein